MGVPSWSDVPADCSAVARATGLVLSFEDVGSSLSFQLLPVCLSTALRRCPGPSSIDWSDSSLGVVQRFPSVDTSAARPLPAPRPRERGQVPSARGCHTPNSFRPCRSSRLRRFSPRITLQVCCTLQPTMGFTTFPARSPLLSRTLPRPLGPGSWLVAVRRQPRQVVFARLPAHPVLPSRRVATPPGLRRVCLRPSALCASWSGRSKTCLAIGCFGGRGRVRPGASPFP